MSAPIEKRYWDSSVFLAWIKGEAGRVEVCEEIVAYARNNECDIFTSAITLAEVLRPRHKGPIQVTETEEAKIVGFFQNPYIKIIDFSAPLGAQSRLLQWRYGLHVRDAIHVASGIAAKVDVIESYDPDFFKVKPSEVPGCPPLREPKRKPLPLWNGAPTSAPGPKPTP